jgi:hypothetical protein
MYLPTKGGAGAAAAGAGAGPAAGPAAAAVPLAPPPPLSLRRRCPTHRPLPNPPRITNARREVFADDEEDPVTSSTLPLPRDYAVYDPELGPLTAAGRVTRTLADELASEAVSLEETAYWFSDPPLLQEGGEEVGEGGEGGWWRRGFSGPAQPEDGAQVERAPELEGRFPSPRHEPGEDEEGEEAEEAGDDGAAPIVRRPLSELRAGEEVFGFVTDCWLYHGAQVDFLCEYDGLIPVSPDAWPPLQQRRRVRQQQQQQQQRDGHDGGHGNDQKSSSSTDPAFLSPPPADAGLFPGLAVRARVHAVRREGLYRWPVQLELLEPASLAGLIVPRAEEWEPPVDLSWARRQGWDFARITAETGRPDYVPAVVAMEPDMTSAARASQRAFGRDDPQSAAWPAGDSPWHRALAQAGGYEAAAEAERLGAAQEQQGGAGKKTR